MSDQGVFIPVMPRLELAAFSSVVTQVKGIMTKAGADMSSSFDGPQAALAKLNAATVEATNAVASANARMVELARKADVANTNSANVAATSAERQIKATSDIEVAEIKLDATRMRTFTSQEARMAALMASQARLDTAVAKSAQVARDTAAANDAAAANAVAATGLAAKGHEDLQAAQAKSVAATAEHNDALAASTGVVARYGSAINTAGIAATGAFAVIGGVSAEAATKFESGMTRFQTAAMVPIEQIGQLQNGLLQLSSSMGVNMGSLQDASLMIAKAGAQYKDAATNLKIMNSAIQLSKMEGADLETTAQQITTYMTSWGVGADGAAASAVKLQRAAADAKRPLEEYLGALHNVEPTAQAMLDKGTGGAQVLGLATQMAQTGAGMDQSTQNLNNFMTNLANPQAPSRAMLGSLGIDSNELSQQLKQPGGLITVLGELHDALGKVTTGTGADAKVHLGLDFKNPQVTKLMGDEYAHLSDIQKQIADRFLAANASGNPVDKNTMRGMRAAAGSDGYMRDWYLNFQKSTGVSQLAKNGIDPNNLSMEQAIKQIFGTQASVRSIGGLWGDPSDKNDQHWERTKNEVNTIQNAGPDKNGNLPGTDALKETSQFKLDQMKAQFHNLTIEIGLSLLPALKLFASTMSSIFGFLNDNKGIMTSLVGILGTMAGAWIAVKVAMGFQSVFSTIGTGIDFAITKFGLMKNAVMLTATEMQGLGAASVATEGEMGTAATAEVGQAAAVTTAVEGEGTAVKSVGKAMVGTIGIIAAAAVAGKLVVDGSMKIPAIHDRFMNPDGSMKSGIDKWIVDNQIPGLDLLEPDGAKTTDQAKKDADAAKIAALTDYSDPMKWGGNKNGPHGNIATPGAGIDPFGTATTPPPGTPGADPVVAATGGAPGSNGPDGTTSNPVQVQIPGFDPSQSVTDQANNMGVNLDGSGGGDGGGLGGGSVKNPLTALASGGFTLANITKVMTTFLMEQALGNPLGKMLTGQGGDSGDAGSSQDGVSAVGDIDKMTAGQRKEATYELQIKKALRAYKKAQADYVRAVTKYGAGSDQADAAEDTLLNAHDAIDQLALTQTNSIDAANGKLSAAQAKVASDQADGTNTMDPAGYAADQARVTAAQANIPTGGASGPGGKAPGLNADQSAAASAIIAEGQKRGLSRDQIVAGLNVAKLESDYGQTGKDAQNQSGTVVKGVFQQDGSYTGDHNDPANAAGQFFDRMMQRAKPGQSAGQQAVNVQSGTYGSGYVDSQGQGSVYDALAGGQPSGQPGAAPGKDWASPSAPQYGPPSGPSGAPGADGTNHNAPGSGGLSGMIGQIFGPGGVGGRFDGGGGGGGGGIFGLPQGLPMMGSGGADAYTGGSKMPGANATYTPDWMMQHGFPALFQRNAGNGADATNLPKAITDLATQFKLSVTDHADTTLHGGNKGKGNTINPMGGWGFDFSGDEANMQALDKYEMSAQNIGNVAQLIHQGGGRNWGVAGGQDVSNTGYYASNYGGHQDHDHIAFAQMPGQAGMPAGYTDPSTWGTTGGAGQGLLGGAPKGGPTTNTPGSGIGTAGQGIGSGGLPGMGVTPSNTAAKTAGGTGSGVKVGGGTLGMAEGLAAAAAGPLAPVAGIAMGEANNFASYIGKVAGIGIEAAQETFSIHDPDGDNTNKGKGWLGKIAGGLAGGHPQAENSAGTAKGLASKDSNGQPNAPTATTSGPTINVTNNNHGVNDPEGIAQKTNQSMMQYPTPPS